MTLNVIKLVYGKSDKSPTAVPLDKCFKSTAIRDCKKQVWKKETVDYSDLKAYKRYTDCRNEKD